MFSRLGSVAETVAALIAIVGAIAAVLWYVFSLQNQIDSAQKEILELRTKLETIATISASTTKLKGERGEKGEKGDRGAPGEQGERGEKGDPGIAGATSDLDQRQMEEVVKRIVAAEISKVAPTVANNSSASGAGNASAIGLFDTSTCIQADDLRKLDVIALRSGNEVCDRSGRLLFRVKEISQLSTKTIFFSNPGYEDGQCKLERKCNLDLLGRRTYVYERSAQDDKGLVALLRFLE